MSSSAVRVGVVGTGFGARVVAPAFAATEGCEVVDVVSARDHAAVAALCDRPGVDLVSVHSPPFLHREHVLCALERGRAVLCDKPFGRDAADATAMAGAAAAAGVVHLVNFEFRRDPVRALVRESILGGELGEVQQVTWSHVSSGSRVPLRPHGWLFDRATGGGWVGAWGSHAIDTLRWWLGDLDVVAASLRTDITERPDASGAPRRCDAEDGFEAVLRTATGTGIAISSTFAAPASVAPRVTVVGTDAVLEVVADSRIALRRADGTREERSAPASEPGADPHLAPMRRWAEAVGDVVREGVAPSDAPDFRDGLACARILDAIRAAGAQPA